MSGIDLIAVASLLLLFHGYIAYPLTLRIAVDLKRCFSKPTPAQPLPKEWPAVSMIIAAYNEEDVLEAKLRNCRELHYPADKLQILVGSDGSKDRTPEILLAHPEVHSMIFETNRGKAAVLNDLIAEASHDILLFCDANTMLLPNALQEIVRYFENPAVGSVSGRLLLQTTENNAALSYGESLYWGIETSIKLMESEWGVVMGANGALYALRKKCAVQLPAHRTVMDDFFMTASVLRGGYQSLLHPLAIGLENTSSERSGEFRRKIRIGRANINYLFRFLPLINPRRPLIAYAFFSHKLLRWFSPILLLSLFLFSCIGAVQQPISLSGALLIAQLLFHAMAWIGWRRDLAGKPTSWSQAAYYFDSMNLALLIGLFQAFRPTQGGGWERVARQEINS